MPAPTLSAAPVSTVAGRELVGATGVLDGGVLLVTGVTPARDVTAGGVTMMTVVEVTLGWWLGLGGLGGSWVGVSVGLGGFGVCSMMVVLWYVGLGGLGVLVVVWRVVLSSGGHDVVFTGGGGQYVLVVVYGGGLWVVMVQGQSGTRVSAVAREGWHVELTGDGEGGCRGRRVSDVVVDEGSGRLRRVS